MFTCKLRQVVLHLHTKTRPVSQSRSRDYSKFEKGKEKRQERQERQEHNRKEGRKEERK